MKIYFFETEPWEQPILEAGLFSEETAFINGTLTAENADKFSEAEIISAFIYSDLSQKTLFKLPNLKFIATRSTGFDHIDLSYCQKKHILVSNVPVYGINSIAEHTFALILALSRHLIPSVERTRHGDFTLDGLRGFELFGKTLGVVGLGHIGSRVVELAKCFGMKVLVNTGHPDHLKAEKIGIEFVDLPTLLSDSDIVTLHVPFNSSTKHMINKSNIALMKKGSILINTARGGIVETEAILWALEQGILGGVGLDVLEEECVLKEERELLTKGFLETCNLKTQFLNRVLLTKSNVIITPHNAFNTQEALTEILKITIDNILAFKTKKQINLV